MSRRGDLKYLHRMILRLEFPFTPARRHAPMKFSHKLSKGNNLYSKRVAGMMRKFRVHPGSFAELCSHAAAEKIAALRTFEYRRREAAAGRRA